MKNYMKISINGYPDSKIDAAIRACTVDNKVVQFQPQPDKAWSATYEGKELSVVADSDFPQSMEEFLAYLKQVRLVLEEDKLTVIPLREAMGRSLGEEAHTLGDSCAGHGGCVEHGGCQADGCAGYGGCVAHGGCGADGCAGYGGCVTKAGCVTDGCAGYGGCAIDAGCATRGCGLDGGCGANVPCLADACGGHACGVDACPANVNVGPCAVDIPVCPIIL